MHVEDVELQPDMTFKVQPVRVLGHQDRQLRNRTLPMVKVQWSQHSEREATWEMEGEMREKYPYLFE